MKNIIYILISCVVSILISNAQAGSLTGSGDISSKTFYSKSYSGSRDRQYKVYTPTSYTGNEAVPMVMVLHGCDMDHNDTVDDWNFDLLADENNFIVVYPYITSYSGMRSSNCWGFWFDSEIHEGGGEVEDLHQIGVEVESQYNVDSNRRYITGLSSGGAMTVIAAVAHNEYWAAAAPAAGLAYGETSSSVALYGMSPTFESTYTTVSDMNREMDDDRIIPLLVIHSNNDTVVKQPAGSNIRDAHISLYNANSSAIESESCSDDGITCTHKKYADDNGNIVVETFFFNGAVSGSPSGKGHYWGGDDSGNWAYSKGPSSSQAAWEFFSRHTLDGLPPAPAVPACEPNCDEVAPSAPTGLFVSEVGEKSISLSWPSNTEEDIAGYTVYKSTQSGTGFIAVGNLTQETNITITGLTPETMYFFIVTATDLSLNESAVSGEVNETTLEQSYFCNVYNSTNEEHVNANRATICGIADLYACAKDDFAELGLNNPWMSSTIYESPEGIYTTNECNPEGPATDEIATPEETDSSDNTTEPPADDPSYCVDNSSSNYSHVMAGRAYVCGFWYACAEGSGDNLGFYNVYSYSTLTETSEGYFSEGSCQ